MYLYIKWSKYFYIHTMFFKTFRFCRSYYVRIRIYLLPCIYTLHTLSKCEQNDDMYIFPSNAWNLFFAQLLKCNHEKTFPIYYSFKEVISIETSIPIGFSESLRDVPHSYTLFLSPNTIRFFFLSPLCVCVVNNKTIVFGRHWFGDGSSGKLDTHICIVCSQLSIYRYFDRKTTNATQSQIELFFSNLKKSRNLDDYTTSDK